MREYTSAELAKRFGQFTALNDVSLDDTGTLLSAQYRNMVRTERTKARERKKYDAIEQVPYTDAQIEEIEAQYDREGPRGAEPRWFEDVHEGDEIGPMVKGPLTVTDMVRERLLLAQFADET